MKRKKQVILSLCLGIFFVFSTGVFSYAYDSLLAFGDSLSDNGAYGYNYEAYGYPRVANYADIYGFRRSSNGPVWVEYLAGPSHYNVPLLDMAYGGAGTGWGNPGAYANSNPSNEIYLYNYGIQWQVNEYKNNFNTISPNTLITIQGGGNDKKFSVITGSAAADNIGLAIQNLINIGGRSFIVPWSYASSDPWFQSFADELSLVIAKLKAQNQNVQIYSINMGGFKPVVDFTNGTWLQQTYGNGTYLYYDSIGGHPTTEVHAQFANYVASQVPIPAAVWLLGTGLVGLIGIRRRFVS